MGVFKYKVVPAPTVGKRAKGVKGTDGRFAHALTEVINDQAQYGWEFLHAESLPAMERHGILRKKRETFQNVLIFRKLTDKEAKKRPETADEPMVNPFKKIAPKRTETTVEEPKAEAPKKSAKKD